MVQLTQEQRNIRVFAVVASLVALSLLVWGITELIASERRVARWDTGSVEVSEDGRTLHLTYRGGACDNDHEVEVEESPDRVMITVIMILRANECTDGIVRREAIVHLDEPLGDRELVEGR
jgi:hypothetical protein